MASLHKIRCEIEWAERAVGEARNEVYTIQAFVNNTLEGERSATYYREALVTIGNHAHKAQALLYGLQF